MNWMTTIFYFFGAITVLSALGILFTRNVLHATFLLMLSFFSVAGIYVLGNASFIGVTQLLIYVGGILILMVFGLMLTTKLNGKALVTENHNRLIGVLLGTVFFSILSYIIIFSANFEMLKSNKTLPENAVEFIGINLMSNYLIPFEIAAILLLIALIGAAVISEKRKEKQE